MPSRVAAVMAPRTHNRRRVTRSSGRRRKGGESEPQRPNMSRRVFTSAVLLLVVVMMCCNACGAAEIAGQASESKFKWKDIKDEVGVTVESLGVPGLLNVGNDVFAVAEAQCKKNSEINSFTGIASQIITKDNANAPVGVLKDPKDTQFLEEGTSEDSKKVDVSRPTTVVEGKDIYMLVGKYSPTAATDQARDWGFLLVKGEVSDQSKKRIKWSYANAVPHASFGEQRQSWSRLIGGGGSGVHTHDGRIMFPVEGTKKEGEKTVLLLIYTLKDDAASWKLSKEAPDGGCSDPSVVEWEKDKKLIMMTACDDGRRRVYESGDMGEEWTEALGTISRVWGNQKDEGAKGVRSGFITATIGDDEDNRNVMLVTLPVYAEEEGKEENGKGKLHLWLTDNTHIVDIGPVSGEDDAAASSLLYRSAGSGDNEQKEELIALYEKKKEDEKPSHSMVYVPLTEQLQRVKEVLATWKKADDLVSKLCPSESDAKDGSPGNACSADGKITDGLVGFLSGNIFGNTWRDEYLGVNATVKKKEDAGDGGATRTSDGVKFTGAWAEWPVGSQGQNQLYHFANYNFTLVATVSIDKLPKEGSPIPLMGVKVNDDENPVLLGLSYDKEKKWKLLCGDETPKEPSSTSEETTHHVVILLRNGNQGSAYVNGQRVGGNVPCDLINTKDKKISHFYIGGDGNSAGDAGRQGEDVSVTVTNVLLYNRPLNDDEINALNPKLSIPKAKDTKTVKVTPPEEIKQATLEIGAPSSLDGQQQTEQYPLKKSKDVGGVGVSTSRETTVANPLPGLDSVQQLASVKYSDGTQSVNAASSSVGDKTLGRGAGDETQNDETHQPSTDTSATADANTPTAKGVGHDGAPVDQEMNTSFREDEEAGGGTDGQEDIHARDGEVNATALSSSLGNISQGNNSDAGTVRGSGLLPSLPLLLGLWVFAAL
ncbi:putative trans-sialidase, Group VI [Trypanosoma cruzi]|nr:putative trans-sialidase, Group VI [Trypanosoma cruzi]